MATQWNPEWLRAEPEQRKIQIHPQHPPFHTRARFYRGSAHPVFMPCLYSCTYETEKGEFLSNSSQGKTRWSISKSIVDSQLVELSRTSITCLWRRRYIQLFIEDDQANQGMNVYMGVGEHVKVTCCVPSSILHPCTDIIKLFCHQNDCDISHSNVHSNDIKNAKET